MSASTILYNVLTKLGYKAQESFSYSSSNNIPYSVLPFSSQEAESQVFLTLAISADGLKALCQDTYMSKLAKTFREQQFYTSDMDKNTSLLIICNCGDDKNRYNSEKICLEDDPYYFKKYVFCYTELEEKRTSEYLKNRQSDDLTTIQNYLTDTQRFGDFKSNYVNEPIYSFLVELATKIPMLPLNFLSTSEFKPINAFLQDELENLETPLDIISLDRLLETIPDFKDTTPQDIMKSWNSILKSEKRDNNDQCEN